jgi:hypothetical protein
MQGDFGRADVILEQVRHQMLAIGQPDVAHSAAIAQAENALQAGRASAALDLLDDADTHARDSGSVLTPAATVIRAQALRALGRTAAAIDAADAGLAEARAQGLVLERALLTAIRARVDSTLAAQELSDYTAEAESQLKALGVSEERIQHLLGR